MVMSGWLSNIVISLSVFVRLCLGNAPDGSKVRLPRWLHKRNMHIERV